MNDSSLKAPVYLVDASIYIFKYYFSLPPHWTSKSGYDTSAVYGYARWLLNLLKLLKPERLAVCFDESLETGFRHQIYPAYKASRAMPDEALAFQLNACKDFTEMAGITCYASDTFEADDLLATLAKKARQQGLPVCIASRDKDLGQIILGEQDFLWDLPEGEKFYRRGVEKKFGVAPEKIADFLALVGDNIDDIPGVPGLGPKTAASVLSHFSGWNEIKQNLAEVARLPVRGAAKLASKLEAYSGQIDMALQLTRLKSNAGLGRRFNIKRQQPDIVLLQNYSTELGLGKGFNTSVERVFG